MCVPVSPAPALHKFIQMYTVVTLTIDFLCMQTTSIPVHFASPQLIFDLPFSHTKKNHQLSKINHILHIPKTIQKTSTLRLWRLIFSTAKVKRKTNISPATFHPPRRNVNILMIQLVRCYTVVLAIALEKSYWIVSNVPALKKKRVGGEVLLLVDDSLM